MTANEGLNPSESDLLRAIRRAALEHAMYYGTRYLTELHHVVTRIWFENFGKFETSDAMALVAIENDYAAYEQAMKAAGLEP